MNATSNIELLMAGSPPSAAAAIATAMDDPDPASPSPRRAILQVAGAMLAQLRSNTVRATRERRMQMFLHRSY